ncbi:zinc finger BED domain-containing protein RICESLEEPER 2-like [Syzygium oleosum]|uniref:zinc finger BED domain-containing protein RICESLEEPER 2-like n=1 Tax=Syzygium oleosum TaxID=219896 RepID=UPI0024BB21BD|nr:zinc finger BED domain-containing protein RICESLEEPER 2-like [Syzygium oleosum]
MRCFAHILSTIVKEGLKDINDFIVKIRSALRYVRSSLGRLRRFKDCVELENIESKSLVCLDVETRWNSTYMMLEAALKFQKAFFLLEIQDSKFVEELSKAKRLPTSDDWNYARHLLPFLKLFFDTTSKVSGSSYVTSNNLANDVYGLFGMINEYCENEDKSLQEMAKRMMTKFIKYYGNVNNINLNLFIACILDPRHKWEYVKWLINDVYESKQAEILHDKVTSSLISLYEQYCTGKCPQGNLRLKGTRTVNVSKSPVDGDELFGPLRRFDAPPNDGVGEWDLMEILPPDGVVTSPNTGPEDSDPESEPMESDPKPEPIESEPEPSDDMADPRSPEYFESDPGMPPGYRGGE